MMRWEPAKRVCDGHAKNCSGSSAWRCREGPFWEFHRFLLQTWQCSSRNDICSHERPLQLSITSKISPCLVNIPADNQLACAPIRDLGLTLKSTVCRVVTWVEILLLEHSKNCATLGSGVEFSTITPCTVDRNTGISRHGLILFWASITWSICLKLNFKLQVIRLILVTNTCV